MLGRLLDVLNLDGELMAAGTKLFASPVGHRTDIYRLPRA